NGDTTSVAVGVYPQAVAIVGTRVFVVNSNLVGSTPAGPSWLTSFDCCGVRTTDSIPLTGANARFAVVGDDSLLYVIAAGHGAAHDLTARPDYHEIKAVPVGNCPTTAAVAATP